MLFYEIVAIVIGVLILIGGIFNLTKNSYNLKSGIILILVGIFYLALGISGFFFPEKYEWVYTTILIVYSIIAMIAVKLGSIRN